MSDTASPASTVITEVLFFDDFTSSELDRTKWNVRVTGEIYNNEQQAYIDSSETLYLASEDPMAGAGNSALIIHPRYRPGFVTPEGNAFDFVSGRIDTRDKMEFCYGTVAARMKLPSGAGLWPAFWMFGNGNWPETGEIDVMEYVGEADWVSAAVHGAGYSGEAALVNKLFLPSDGDATAWHVYSVDWQPDSLLFKVDDMVMYRVTRAMTDFFGSWAFDTRKFLILNFALGGVYPFKTNGVQVPYYGLPASTADLIKRDQIKVAVDWVKVARHTPVA
ncbi:MAG: glycoside hydrolase family 16 protein [Anaerolineae bacterium]